MRNGTSFGTWLPVIIVGIVAAALVVGCRQETPPAPRTAAKVAEIAVVNPARGFVDSIALSPDASHVATGERNGSIRVWAHANAAAPIPLGEYRQAIVDLAFSPNAGMLASLGHHGEGAVRLCDATGFAAITSIVGGGKLTHGVEI